MRKYRRAARLGCNLGLSGRLLFDSSNKQRGGWR
jgi:hypothetical protein